ncbi:MAG: hypothetical protein Q9186_001306 [Xanthomendoza sp. 1 TL-2023]
MKSIIISAVFGLAIQAVTGAIIPANANVKRNDASDIVLSGAMIEASFADGNKLNTRDASKADVLRAKVLGSNAHQRPVVDSSASATGPSGPADTAGPAASSCLPQAESEALPDQAMPQASAKYGVPKQAPLSSAGQRSDCQEAVVSETPVLIHGKKRDADKQCVRAVAGTEAAHGNEAAAVAEAAAGTEAAATVESESAMGVIGSVSQAAEESQQATHTKKGGSKKVQQGTLPAAFAKAKVLD